MSQKPVILDCLGGDEPIEQNINAVVELIQKDGASIPLILVGPESEIRGRLKEKKIDKVPDYIQFVNCQGQFGMKQEARDVLKDKDNTLMRSLELLKEGKGSAVVSAGHTGAVFVASIMILGRMEGVLRPAIGVAFPTKKGISLILDAGANVDCKPEHLYQFGLMGAVYYRMAFDMDNVHVGLLNNGEESSKGSRATRQAYVLMENMNQQPGLKFDGMLDASGLFQDPPHVVVTDGYIGNIVVKTTESLIDRFKFEMKRTMQRNFFTRLGVFLSKRVWLSVKHGLDFRAIGGAPFLGLKGNVFVCHGRSDGHTIAQCVRRSMDSQFEIYQDQLRHALSVGS